MRYASFTDCLRVLNHYMVNPSKGLAIDVGGTESVSLLKQNSCKVERNPLLNINTNIFLLDAGFNVEFCKTKTHAMVDFLNPDNIRIFIDRFDIVFSFDTLEHVANPFLFCNHLWRITKPGGYIYLSTLFTFPYHPSPEDYFRFSPSGLSQCFNQWPERAAQDLTILWNGWESDGYGVAILIYKGSRPENIYSELSLVQTPQKINNFQRVLRKIMSLIQRHLELKGVMGHY